MKPIKDTAPGIYLLGRKMVGCPGSVKKPKEVYQVKHREGYEKNMLDALWLVRDEGFRKMKATSHINQIKRNPVLGMTLCDRLRNDQPASKPTLGRRQENNLHI
jgi:hypothetical protein